MTTLIIAAQLLLSLTILVTLHEMGHFFPAKFFKTKVDKFYLFFDFLFPISTVMPYSLAPELSITYLCSRERLFCRYAPQSFWFWVLQHSTLIL